MMIDDNLWWLMLIDDWWLLTIVDNLCYGHAQTDRQTKGKRTDKASG